MGGVDGWVGGGREVGWWVGGWVWGGRLMVRRRTGKKNMRKVDVLVFSWW